MDLGRFLSRDRFEGFSDKPVSLHDYIYGNNNPISFIDPTGNVSITELGVAAEVAITLASLTTITKLALESIFCPEILPTESIDVLKSFAYDTFVFTLALSGGATLGTSLFIYAVKETAFDFEISAGCLTRLLSRRLR
jgi:hypothetical protein